MLNRPARWFRFFFPRTGSLMMVDAYDQAVARGFCGSPTVLIDGVDPFADEDAPVGMACRVFQTEVGLAGSPSLDQLRRAITTAQEGADQS